MSRVRIVPFVVVVSLVLGLLVAVVTGPGVAPARAAGVTASAGGYVPVGPSRLLDTRSHVGGSALNPLGVLTLPVEGQGVVPTGGVSAVVLNVTVTAPTGSGFLTAYAAGPDRPLASNLNFSQGETVANLVVVAVSSDGKVDFFNGSPGTTQLIADVSGYFTSGTASAPGAFTSVAPSRLLDTRTGTGAAKMAVASGHSVSFAVPVSASAAVLNLTVTAPTAGGDVTAYPDGGTRPTTSNLNFSRAETVPNLAVVPVGADGRIELYNDSGGTVQLVADIAGYFGSGSPADGQTFGALSPDRLLDTRTDVGEPGGVVKAGGTVTLTVTGRGGVPTSGVSAVALNVTAATPSDGGYLTVYAGGSTRPLVSNLNFTRNQTVPNLVIAKPSANGTVSIFNGSGGTVRIVVDVFGYVLSTGLTVPTTSVSHYVSSVTGPFSDSSTAGEGCADATAGSNFTLLDIGAQTVTSPLSTVNPGVALVDTDPVVRVGYVDLVHAVNDYLASFAACLPGGSNATIAIGTNNDGAFAGATAYPASQRGADWANDVIDQIVVPAHIVIAAADDIEAGFASTEAQAEQWETAFLANTPANLVYNGSLDNCPDTFAASTDCGAVLDDNHMAKTWTRAQYVRLTYALGPGRISVLPQIYFASQPNQAMTWTDIDLTSGHKLTFLGSLTEYGDCGSSCSLTPTQGWTTLSDALAATGVTPGAVATDLKIG